MLLGYRHFFNEQNPDYSEHTGIISSRKLIHFTSIFNNQHLFQKQFKVESQREIMNKLLVSVNQPERGRLEYLFNKYFSNESSSTLLFNVIANLKIIEKELNNYRIIDDDNLTGHELIMAYFKAYLTVNDEIDQEQTIVFEPTQNDQKYAHVLDEGLKYFLPAHLPYHEIMYKSDFVYQLYIAIKFFGFIDTREDLKNTLTTVLNNYGQNSWQGYLKEIYKLVSYYHQIQENDNILRFEEDVPQFISINSHPVQQQAAVQQGRYGDFTFLRKYPIVQLSENERVISYLQLLLDKVFQGFKFDFIRTMMALPQFASFGDAASELSQKFSHPVFETVMKNCFDGSATTLLFDNELGQITDGYLRNEETVFLFEFKDEIIPISVKCSSRFEDIKNGIFEKFVFNTRQNRKKAVHQLIDAIRHLSLNLKEIDPRVNPRSKITYVPVIVYTDMTLDFPGVNRLLNDEFKRKRKDLYRQINASARGSVREIKDLVLINFRLFVDYQDRFKQCSITLDELIQHYYYKQEEKRKQSMKPIRSTEEIFQFFISGDQIFYSYIKRKLGRYVTPTQIKDEVEKLFPNSNGGSVNVD
jgi:hypothetical protein